MMRIYVGCSLTQAPQDFIEMVLSVKVLLREQGYEVMEFFGLGAGSPTDVYRMDIHTCLRHCTMFLAICDYPAIGLGWELGTAVEKNNTPTLAVAHTDSVISRLPIGAECELNPNYQFERYESAGHIVELVHKFARKRTLIPVMVVKD